jgi:hypothetical protein
LLGNASIPAFGQDNVLVDAHNPFAPGALEAPVQAIARPRAVLTPWKAI